MNYSEWQDTADTLRLFLQMAGKVKVMRSLRRPEWTHVCLYLQPDGLTTGIIPGDTSPFSIFFDFRQHQVEFRNGEGKRVDIPLTDGLSVADFYRHFLAALDQMGSPTPIDVKPQKFHDPVNFDQDVKHHSYDKIAVRLWLKNLLFTYGALSRYVAVFAGKVHYPAYYFGTMDLSCTVFSGKPVVADGVGPICSYALDEQMYECGFRTGDAENPQPVFYAMPYPFIEDLQGNAAMLQPDKATFHTEKKEFLFSLEDAFSYPDPEARVTAFFRSGFDLLQHLQPWENLSWLLRLQSENKNQSPDR